MDNPLDAGNMTNTVTAVIIAVIIVAVLLVPIVGAVSEPIVKRYVIENEGEDYWAEIDGNTHEMIISLVDGTYKVTTDGEEVRSLAATPDNIRNPFNIGDNAEGVDYKVISSNGNAISVLFSNGYLYGYIGNTAYPSARITAESPLAITISSTLDYTDGVGVSRSIPTDIFAGKGALVESSESKVIDDTVFYIAWYNSVVARDYTTCWLGYVGNGTMDNLPPTIDTVAAEPLTPQDTEYTLYYEDVQESDYEYTALRSMGFVTGWGTEHGESQGGTSFFIVPDKITLEIPGEGIGTTGILLGVVPIFVILGIILGIAAYMSPTIRNRI